MIKICVLLAVMSLKATIPLASAREWQCGDAETYYDGNCDFEGYDMENGAVQSGVTECDGICQRDPQCTHFTWYNGICLKKRIQYGGLFNEREFPGAVCGHIYNHIVRPLSLGTFQIVGFRRWQERNGGQVLLDQHCDFKWEDIGSQHSSEEECRKACLANAQCDHFTWVPRDRAPISWDSGICYMKKFTPESHGFYGLHYLGAEQRCGAVCGVVPDRLCKPGVPFDRKQLSYSSHYKL